MEKKVEWLGSRCCDFCPPPKHTIIGDLYDAKTTLGPWATMCKDHYDQYGIGLGLGQGQRYQQVHGHFIKVEG